MKNQNIIGALVLCIVLFAAIATIQGIFSTDGGGVYKYLSIRNHFVEIYGVGLYKHMSTEVALQGIAQDIITLCLAIPLFIASFYFAKKGNQKALFVFTGTCGYFLVTYLFYSVMAMYNSMYFVYVIIAGCSFYAFVIVLMSLHKSDSYMKFSDPKVSFPSIFLIATSIIVALMWLKIIITPILHGSFIPMENEHYTTLVVQAFDLSILLPAAIISGWLLIRRKPLGFTLAPTYLIFLSLLMIALTSKVLILMINGYNVFPTIFIIPVMAILSIAATFRLLTSLSN